MTVQQSQGKAERPNREGQTVPEVTFRLRRDDQWLNLTSNDVFAGKTVVVFALPGAFTPTCSSTHVPRYNELASVLKREGVDNIVCISVNDAFVMDAWQREQNAGNIEFIADGNGAFTDGMGMLVDKEDLGFGRRSWRYSMLVRDGVIEKMFIEPDVPGDPFEVSDADTMLNHLNPNAQPLPDVTVVSKPGCSHCARARDLLRENGLTFENIELGSSGISFASLRALSGNSTAPQVFVGGELIGGADELGRWLEQRKAA